MDKVNIELSDIFEYISSSRPIREGEAVFKAGHVILCGLKADADVCTIIGSCLQTSDLNGAPHLIEIVVKSEIQQWEAKFSCKAGLGGKCKHIVAVLVYANREQYHKDEHKKSDNWYSNKHKSGEWIKFGFGNSKHHALKHDKDSNGKYQAAKHSDKYGKEHKYAGGHDKGDHRGQQGAQQHYAKHEEAAKEKAHVKH